MPVDEPGVEGVFPGGQGVVVEGAGEGGGVVHEGGHVGGKAGGQGQAGGQTKAGGQEGVAPRVPLGLIESFEGGELVQVVLGESGRGGGGAVDGARGGGLPGGRHAPGQGGRPRPGPAAGGRAAGGGGRARPLPLTGGRPGRPGGRGRGGGGGGGVADYRVYGEAQLALDLALKLVLKQVWLRQGAVASLKDGHGGSGHSSHQPRPLQHHSLHEHRSQDWRKGGNHMTISIRQSEQGVLDARAKTRLMFVNEAGCAGSGLGAGAL